VKFEVPDAVGVPEMVPVDEPSERPAGRLPETTDHEYGVTPPVAATVWLYATPTVPPGKLDVVITRSAGATYILSAWSSVSGVPWLSVTRTVKFDVPDAVGVPLMVPVDEPRERPAGRLPETIDQLYGVTPPVAWTVWEYAVPMVPFGRVVVVMTRSAGAALTVMESA